MAESKSKVGIILGITGAIAAIGVATYLIIRNSKKNKLGAAPARGGSLVPTKPPKSATPPIASQQGLEGVFKGLLDALGIGGKGKGGGSPLGGSAGGGGGSSSGGGKGGSAGGVKGGAANANWDSPDKFDKDLGGYVQSTGDIYDKQGNYLGYLDDRGVYHQYDDSIGGHIDQFGNVTDMDGNDIGFVDSDGEVHFTQTLSDGTIVDELTGDAWDANGNYLGFTNDDGDFVSYVDGEYIDQFGGVYDSYGEMLGVYDDAGGFHYFGDTDDDYFQSFDEGFGNESGVDDSYFYSANGMQVKSNRLSNTVVTANGKILNTKISKRNG